MRLPFTAIKARGPAMTDPFRNAAFITVRDTDINAIVNDYRAGRIDSAAFQAKVKAWKDDWQQRVANVMPGHAFEVKLDAVTHMPVFKLSPKPLDPDTGLPKHLIPETPDKTPRGPSR